MNKLEDFKNKLNRLKESIEIWKNSIEIEFSTIERKKYNCREDFARIGYIINDYYKYTDMTPEGMDIHSLYLKLKKNQRELVKFCCHFYEFEEKLNKFLDD